MKQGASRHSFADRGRDLYETPECAIAALVRYQDLQWRIWEPCAGRGAISRVLTRDGHDVIAQDLVAYPGADEGIITPVDFLMERDAPKGFDTIVTNPPYRLANQFIRHGLSLCSRVIVLLRLMALEGAGRSDLIDRHLSHVWVGIERLPMMHRDGWDGKKSTSNIPYAWFVFDRERSHQTTLQRISWKAA